MPTAFTMKYKSLSDEMLLLYLRSGDQEAFREIYGRYWKKLYAMTRRKIQSLDAVEEVVQNIFLRLWEHHDTLRVQCLEAYLVTAARYETINYIKSKLVQEKYALHAQLQFNEATYTTDEELDLKDLMNAVEQQLNELPEKTRQIFRLNRLQHQSVKEISSQLNIPERTIEYHLSQAIKVLRIHLSDYLLAGLLLSSLL